MRKQLLKFFNSKKTAFLLLAFMGLCSFQVNAQNSDFNGTVDALWTNTSNWTGGVIAVNRATIKADLDLETGPRTVKEIRFTGGGPFTVSNGTFIVGDSGSNNTINNGTSGNVGTFDTDCIFTVNVNGKRFRNNGTLIFNGTLAVGGNVHTFLDLAGADHYELNGTVTGTNLLKIQGLVNLGSSSNLTGYTGDYEVTDGNSLVSSTTSVFVNTASSLSLDGTGSLTVNGADTVEGDILRSATTAGSAEVTFNANQSNIDALKVDTQNLTMDFDSSTAVVFSGYTTSTTEGVVNLQNYTSGELRIGTTATSVPSAVLDTWTVDGAAATITQDADGYILSNAPTVTTYATTANGTWEAGATWVGGVAPSAATDNVTINHDVTINSDVTVNDFTIVSGSTTVEAGHSLTVNGAAATDHQLFANSTATSFASLMLNGTVTKAVAYNRWVASNGQGNDLISAPFAENLNKIISQDGEDLFENQADTDQKLFGPFNNSTGAFEIWNTVVNPTATPGTGYRAATATAGTLQFKSTIAPIANIDVAITDGGHGTYGKWNLIGNPYPTYLNFQEFFTANTGKFETGLNNAVYIWNGTSYSAYNNSSTTNTSLITPGEGFFVKTASASETVTFTPVMRRIESDGGTVLFKSGNSSERALAKLNLSTAGKTYATDIYFIQGQTRGLDNGYDAGAFAGSTDGIYTNLVNDNNGENLLIQALPYDDYNNVVVPVAVNSAANTELTISLDVASLTLPENTYVFLKDNVLNTTTLLNDSDYVFTPETALSGAGRFLVEFSAKTVLATEDFNVNEMLIYTNQASKSIMINGVLKADVNVKVFDVQGRMVLAQKLDSSSLINVVNANALNTGVYIVKLEDKIKKVIIK